MTGEEHKTSEGASHPAIRTMSSDIDELLKTSRPTASQMITRETPTALSPLPGMPQQQRRSRGIFVIIFGIVLICGVIGAGIWYFLPSTQTPTTSITPGSLPTPGTPRPLSTPLKTLPPPAPLFSTDASRTITIPDDNRSVFLKLVTDTLQEPEQTGTVKRVLIKLQKGQSEHYASMTEFFDLWHIAPPQNFLQHLDPAFMFFVSYGSDGPTVGFATKTRDSNRTLSDIFFWEQSMTNDLAPFFFQEQVKPPNPPLFEDRTSLNTDWRYIKLSSQKDLGIGYLIFQANRLVVFTTSKMSMERIIKTLYGTQ